MTLASPIAVFDKTIENDKSLKWKLGFYGYPVIAGCILGNVVKIPAIKIHHLHQWPVNYFFEIISFISYIHSDKDKTLEHHIVSQRRYDTICIDILSIHDTYH